MLPVPDHSAPSSAPGTIVNAASFAADQQSRRAPQSVASTTLKLLQLNALHQQGQSDSSKVMCCLAIDKWSVKLCHSRSLTDVRARSTQGDGQRLRRVLTAAYQFRSHG